MGDARVAAIKAYPRGNVRFLEMEETGSFDCADWTSPKPGPYGMEFGTEGTRREAKRVVKKSLSQTDARQLPPLDAADRPGLP